MNEKMSAVSHEVQLAETAAGLKEFADKVLATEWFPKQFRANLPAQTMRLAAMEFGVNRMVAQTFAFLPPELMHVMSSKVLMEVADLVGSTKEEMNTFLHTDAHDYLSMESMEEKCKLCDSRETCDQYKEHQAKKQN